MHCLSAVVVLAVVAVSQAYPNGAPTLQMDMMMNSMCTTGNLRPNHKANNQLIFPQFGPAPYTLRVENANVPYRSGNKVRVTLKANPGKTFKGFFITGDGEDAKTGFQGNFEAAPGSQAKKTRFCAQGMTHTNRNPKTAVTVLWDPPANFTHGRVQFKATVVESFDRFYTGVVSNTVDADSTVDTQSQFAQKQMQQMYANAGQGGMFGGANMQEMMKNLRNAMGNQGMNMGRSNPLLGGNFGFQG